jgi:CRISPR-associated protein Cmr6
MWLASSRERWGRSAPEEAHAGLEYARGAPLAVLRNEDPDAREQWLARLAQCKEPSRYAHAYRRWQESLGSPDTLCFTVRALGRVLVGHGTSTATGVGLTLQHTWGVPVLPGSALKGLTAHYVQTVYGPEMNDREEPEREPFRGTTWKDTRPIRAPGALFRRLFGAPDLDDASGRATQGEVIFHDALWVPAKEGRGAPMLARDVLTVHQRRYYESGGQEWPVDFDDPNPVPFLTVAPGGRFLVALEAPGDRPLLERAERYVKEALADWGLGGKTAAGYGRFASEEPKRDHASSPARSPAAVLQSTPVLTELKAWLEEQKARKVGQRQQFQQLEGDWAERLLGLTGEGRRAAVYLLKQYFNLKRGEEQQRMEELLARLST